MRQIFISHARPVQYILHIISKTSFYCSKIFILYSKPNNACYSLLLPLQDLCPKTNAISLDRSSSNGGTTAGASNVATNYIPNRELQSFKDAHELGDVLASKKLTSLSKKTIFNLTCASQARRSLNTRSGWGIPAGFRLLGGAGGDTSVANGTSGWGPPPTGGAASTSGWGAPPPPNPTASAAWGAPISGQGEPPARAPGFGEPARAPGFGEPSRAPGFGEPARAPGFGDPARAPGFGEPARAPGFGEPARAPGFGPPKPLPNLNGK